MLVKKTWTINLCVGYGTDLYSRKRQRRRNCRKYLPVGAFNATFQCLCASTRAVHGVLNMKRTDLLWGRWGAKQVSMS